MKRLTRSNITVVVAVLALSGVGLRGLVGATTSAQIAILTSHAAAPYEAAVTGFRQYLQQQGVPADIAVYALDGDAARAAAALQQVKQSQARLLLTLGTIATQSALQDPLQLPVIAGLILRADDLPKAANATGVMLEFPIETQLRWLQQFLPEARTIGVLYNPRENQPRIATAVQVAEKLGLKLVAQAVNTPQELPAALDNLAKKVDVLWGIVDSLVLTAQTAKQILLFSFRNRIPFVGLSAPWVKAGALYALEWDYVDLGAQCGEIALKVLQGVSAPAMPPLGPRKVLYSFNTRTARHMKRDIPEALIRGAREVFE